jgi:uncharacterized protein (TIGR02453 family)
MENHRQAGEQNEMTKELRFTPELFTVLRELKANNNREWFEANKPRYLATVREPLLAFVAAWRPRLMNISPHFVADPKPMGGSVYRPYRDTRFSKNKDPYKTVASAYFWHEAGKENTPGFYLHLEPDQCFVGFGIYQPETALRQTIAYAIATKPEEWLAIKNEKNFKKTFTFGGTSLQRVPKPYEPDHPLAEDLKRKDFIVVGNLTEKQVCAKDFLDKFEALAVTAAPLMAFLTRTANLKW